MAQGTKALTPAEQRIVQAVLASKNNKEIARDLAISEETVKRHLSNIFIKWDCSSRLELAMTALQSREDGCTRAFRCNACRELTELGPGEIPGFASVRLSSEEKARGIKGLCGDCLAKFKARTEALFAELLGGKSHEASD